MKPAAMLLRYLLPAVAGVVAGRLLTAEPPVAPVATAEGKSEGRQNEVRVLPDKPEVIRLAALAGRTTEARAKLAELVKAGAGDQEIAEWLAPVLVADPAWLEQFILTVPEERRTALIREVFPILGHLHIDAAWELMRHSPSALAAARDSQKIDNPSILAASFRSPLAAAFLLDPANGFTEKKLAESLRWSVHTPENARRVMEEWEGDRWPAGKPPEHVATAWWILRQDPAALEKLKAGADPGHAAWLEQQDEEEAIRKGYDNLPKNPDAAQLAALGPALLERYAEESDERGERMPLATLAALPAAMRGGAVDNYLGSAYPFHAEGVLESLRDLPKLGFTAGEQETLLSRAIDGEWHELGNLESAMGLLEMMPEGEARTRQRAELLEDLANFDPEAALDYAATLPAGDERDQLEQRARKNLP